MKKNWSRLVVGILIIAVILVAAMPGFAAPKYNWKLASVLPKDHPVNTALKQFAERVYVLTKGEVNITVFTDGQLGQEADYFQGCTIGATEIIKVSSSPTAQYVPQMDALGIPFIWRNEDHQHKALDGKVGEILAANCEPAGFKLLAYMDAGFRNFTLRDKAVKTPADLKGLKVRTQQSKLMLDVVAAFGATAVPLGQSDVYTALSTKVIDGWENNEPTVLGFNMQEVCKYFSYTRHSSVPDLLLMNLKLFNSVPKADQDAIMQAAKEATLSQRKLWADYMKTVVSQLKAKGMIFNQVKNIKAFQDVVKPAVDKYVANSKVKDELTVLIKEIQDTK